MLFLRSFYRKALAILLVVTFLCFFLFHKKGFKLSESGRTIQLHRLAIIVPYRNRPNELEEFIPHMNNFLTSQSIDYKIFIINQTDKYRFNRAVLINIGYIISKKEGYDYMAMHDVDLLPADPRLSYKFPPNGAFHLSSPSLHPLYHYESFVGGIFIISHDNFERINGMSNRYWGWGLEDDEFYTRLRRANITITRPTFNSTTAFKHTHDKKKHKRDYREKIPSLLKVDRKTGLTTIFSDGEKELKMTENNDSQGLSVARNEDPPPAYFDVFPDANTNEAKSQFDKISSRLPPVNLNHPVPTTHENNYPVTVPSNIQLFVVPATTISARVDREEEEARRVRSIALPLAILSLFFGPLLCALPALICACRRNAPISYYRRSIAMSTVAMIMGMTGLIYATVGANRHGRAYM